MIFAKLADFFKAFFAFFLKSLLLPKIVFLQIFANVSFWLPGKIPVMIFAKCSVFLKALFAFLFINIYSC